MEALFFVSMSRKVSKLEVPWNLNSLVNERKQTKRVIAAVGGTNSFVANFVILNTLTSSKYIANIAYF